MPGALHNLIQTIGRLESAVDAIQKTMVADHIEDRDRWKDIEAVVEALSIANRTLTKQVEEVKKQIKWAVRIGSALWAVVGATIMLVINNYEMITRLYHRLP